MYTNITLKKLIEEAQIPKDKMTVIKKVAGFLSSASDFRDISNFMEKVENRNQKFDDIEDFDWFMEDYFYMTMDTLVRDCVIEIFEAFPKKKEEVNQEVEGQIKLV